jgi:hypothetical protein
MNHRIFATLLGCLLLVGCAGSSPSATVTGAPTAAPSTAAPSSAAPSNSAPSSAAPSTPAIVLREAPANLGCDTIGIDYQNVTFRIDPAAAEQVSAVTDTGVTLLTYWAAGFEPGTADERLIRDPDGQVVATDGEVLAVPQGAQTRLHGYFVCLAPEALYVLLADPT